ncbi:hypothetical protein MLD38_031897 [Melastoma candidum]|uniref:Uncharacterized protein n=1 Tax=Melastoma candidum TaxID=119954 RepID=A0ACB9MR42_9MYRT|nr:hypothetical protein MLD38_031897 [Melastoma candidum]
MLEICSPDSFSATPVPAQGFVFPGEESASRLLAGWLAEIQSVSLYPKSCRWQVLGPVVRCLKSVKGLVYEDIPWGTFNVVERLSHSFPLALDSLPARTFVGGEGGGVDRKTYQKIVETLLPFQL